MYFKKGDKQYKFPRDQFAFFKSKLKIDTLSKSKTNEKLFKERKFHNSIIFASKKLFINGHYPQSIFEAFLTTSKFSLFNKKSPPEKPISIFDPFKFSKIFNLSSKDRDKLCLTKISCPC